ncbi:MAG: hypothetical protein JNJ77_21740 [Planctomycetia bacterium]|nr:hypothetical protein [Planctomycetia bacterium]
MRRKYLILGLVIALTGFLAWWFWPVRALTPQLLDQIKPGMTADEAIAILGKPTSDRYLRDGLGIDRIIVEVDGKSDWQNVVIFRPQSSWNSYLQVARTEEFPGNTWQSGQSHFWIDQHKLLWITIDKQKKVKQRGLCDYTARPGEMSQWADRKLKSLSPPAPPAKTAPAPLPNPFPEGEYVFEWDTTIRVVHPVIDMDCVGTIDKNGTFVADLMDVDKAIEASKKGTKRELKDIPRLVEAKQPNEKVYEFRSGVLIPMIIDAKGRLLPEIDGEIIESKDYQYSPKARRIYNLPGRFVPKATGKSS